MQLAGRANLPFRIIALAQAAFPVFQCRMTHGYQGSPNMNPFRGALQRGRFGMLVSSSLEQDWYAGHYNVVHMWTFSAAKSALVDLTLEGAVYL